MNRQYYLVLSTCPEDGTAERIADALVELRVAACVNIVTGVTSIYQWQGQRERSGESLLLIKTRRDRYAALESALRSLHPYEVPEIIALALEDGLAAYLAWVEEQLQVQ
ncbi:MAG: divalent-cation tolerance protein CutA [Gammaproteobacteria bacterium]